MKDTEHCLPVSAGIILREDGAVLVCQRRDGSGRPWLWEFPGGKREAGESDAQCLARECLEELRIHLRVGALLARFDWPTDAPRMRFSFFLATIASGEPVCLEHAQIRWVRPQALAELPFCGADASILPQIARRLSAGALAALDEPIT